MKKLISIVILTASVLTLFGQCSALFSFAAYFEKVTFYNQSNISNAHYFWNFGDGTSSFYQNPIHKFPASGTYLTTLFIKDTITNCSAYYEKWINLKKQSADSCQPSISDTFYSFNGSNFWRLKDHSIKCEAYRCYTDVGTSFNDPNFNAMYVGYWKHARYLGRIKCLLYDSGMTKILDVKEAFATFPYQYSSTKNYNDCSANFEFSIIDQDSFGQRILYKAMNKTAKYYEWNIIGFGNTIYSNFDTISQYYQFNNYSPISGSIAMVALITSGSSGCSDTLLTFFVVLKSTAPSPTKVNCSNPRIVIGHNRRQLDKTNDHNKHPFRFDSFTISV